MKVVDIINLCHEKVASNSRTSLQLSHSSEIGAYVTLFLRIVRVKF